ncbi:MAG: SAM-dependent methyltransferase, partial [Legionellales bacterium]|nr:SAM-dependent methyltransferase [Legionellales bacterium]
MSIWRNLFLQHLSHLQQGEIIVRENQQHYTFGQPNSHLDLAPVELNVHDPNFYRHTILAGDKGVALSFIHGGWSTNDLAGLMRLYLRNLPAFQSLNYRWRRLGSWLKKFRWHSINQSKQHILRHYDLSNDFFASWLDRSMLYSCTMFPTPDTTLAQASHYTLQRLGEKLALDAQDHLLEIGSGWGSMAFYAAQHYGCRVTTTTISDQQYQYIKQQVAQLGLTQQITVLN